MHFYVQNFRGPWFLANFLVKRWRLQGSQLKAFSLTTKLLITHWWVRLSLLCGQHCDPTAVGPWSYSKSKLPSWDFIQTRVFGWITALAKSNPPTANMFALIRRELKKKKKFKGEIFKLRIEAKQSNSNPESHKLEVGSEKMIRELIKRRERK